MNDILQQIGKLFLGSVPTIFIFVFLVLAYRFLVYGPLMRVLAERRERTLGAVEKAQAAIGAADAKAQEYEAKLRAARAEIFRAREQRIQHWNGERETALEGGPSGSTRAGAVRARCDRSPGRRSEAPDRVFCRSACRTNLEGHPSRKRGPGGDLPLKRSRRIRYAVPVLLAVLVFGFTTLAVHSQTTSEPNSVTSPSATPKAAEGGDEEAKQIEAFRHSAGSAGNRARVSRQC